MSLVLLSNCLPDEGPLDRNVVHLIRFVASNWTVCGSFLYLSLAYKFEHSKCCSLKPDLQFYSPPFFVWVCTGGAVLCLKLGFCREHNIPSLSSSCELLATLYAHHYKTYHEILQERWKFFQRRSPMLCLRRTGWTGCFPLHSTWSQGMQYLQWYRSGCGFESHLEQAAVKIGLGLHIHAFPHELFIKDVRRSSEDSEEETRSCVCISVQTHEDRTLFCTHQRCRIFYCQAGVAQAAS